MAIIIGFEGPDDSIQRLAKERPTFVLGKLINMPLSNNTGEWQCLTCDRSFPANFEPDHCPDCGTQLVRLRHRSISV